MRQEILRVTLHSYTYYVNHQILTVKLCSKGKLLLWLYLLSARKYKKWFQNTCNFIFSDVFISIPTSFSLDLISCSHSSCYHLQKHMEVLPSPEMQGQSFAKHVQSDLEPSALWEVLTARKQRWEKKVRGLCKAANKSFTWQWWVSYWGHGAKKIWSKIMMSHILNIKTIVLFFLKSLQWIMFIATNEFVSWDSFGLDW